jgi:O-acetyl-ADP-ribose deacetylase (regulator of RNase III)
MAPAEGLEAREADQLLGGAGVTAIELHLRDLGEPLVDAWRREFAGAPSVTISRGDIFSTKSGAVDATDPIDVKADAIVSPANSFGFMDGGIDAVYTYQFGHGLQERLQALLAADHGGELPVGMAVIVSTGSPDIPWCISAPTMRTPGNVADTVNAYLAFGAALRAVIDHNARGQPTITRVLCPGLGTAVGMMPVARCARQMRAAWDRVVGGAPVQFRSLHAAAEDERQLLR